MVVVGVVITVVVVVVAVVVVVLVAEVTMIGNGVAGAVPATAAVTLPSASTSAFAASTAA